MIPVSSSLMQIGCDMCVCARVRVCTDLYSQLCPTPCDPMDYIGARQTPLSMEFSRQEYWRGLPFSFP